MTRREEPGTGHRATGTGEPQEAGTGQRAPGTGEPQEAGTGHRAPGTGEPQESRSGHRATGTGAAPEVGSGQRSPGTGAAAAHGPQVARGGTWTATRKALLPLLVVMLACLLALFEREWRHGEVFSPADLVFQFYPWAHDAPRTPAANPTRSDEAFYHQPLMATHFARLRGGEWPDFDDSRLAGVPAFFQGLDVGRAFSPFSLPFYLLPAEDAVNWYGPLRLLVAALAMWLFLRDLGAGAIAAALAGVAYGLNGHFLTWLSAPMPTVAAWLPLVLRQVRRCARGGGIRDVAGLALATGALCLGGYMATTLVCLFGAGVYGLVELWAARVNDEETVDQGRRLHEGEGRRLPRGEGRRLRGGEGRWPLRRFGALVGGGVLGLAVGAVAWWPMVAALRTSPAGARVVSAEGAPWPNLATLALPDFWGSPVRGNWWHPDPSANYPEHVAYFGIVVAIVAGLALVARLPRPLSIVRWTFVGLLVVALTRAYGGFPGRWLLVLPGQAQSNPFRWYALAACALAVLAGLGLQAWLTEADGRRRLRQLAGPTLVAGALAAVTAAALLALLPDLRARNLQGFERAQLLRLALIAGATLLPVYVGAWVRDARVRMACGLWLVALAGADLVQAHRGFNPTVPRDRYYPETPTLAWLREEAASSRVAPVDTAGDLIEGHVWSMYGIDVVTGFDYHGDPAYQRYMQLAQHPPGESVAPRPAAWDFVGLRRETLDLRMLGVLGARYIVAPPLDLTPRAGGYVPIGPVGDGTVVTLTVPVRHDGLRGIDLLTATHGRRNKGRWHYTVTHATGGRLAAGVIEQAALPNTEWWRLTWTPVQASRNSSITVTIRGEGSGPDDSATIMATATPSALGTTLTIDDRADLRTLWFRTFSTAPDRFGEAPLVRAGDLNVYRNPYARPRAWFVLGDTVAPASSHAAAMHAGPFEPARHAWVDGPPSHEPSATARVTSVSLDDDTRTIGVDAPDGGLLVIGDRAHAGWDVTVDGRAVPWQVADGVLIGVGIPPGARTVVLQFRQPSVRPALGLSLLALSGIALAVVASSRRARP
ncbi:YfhO family protein [Luteitalea sp. TBR-22]|uniref:YfhO family protein n=1 Tax=Luteitalea sp. TBR-22 TaxID=2802971 RepID=UPI001EF62E42|nr:YfhO family protein [Luteitalea sp. TBR-22]